MEVDVQDATVRGKNVTGWRSAPLVVSGCWWLSKGYIYWDVRCVAASLFVGDNGC